MLLLSKYFGSRTIPGIYATKHYFLCVTFDHRIVALTFKVLSGLLSESIFHLPSTNSRDNNDWGYRTLTQSCSSFEPSLEFAMELLPNIKGSM